jgi:hypothetical protein
VQDPAEVTQADLFVHIVGFISLILKRYPPRICLALSQGGDIGSQGVPQCLEIDFAAVAAQVGTTHRAPFNRNQVLFGERGVRSLCQKLRFPKALRQKLLVSLMTQLTLLGRLLVISALQILS